jgi:CubicO group peptidase (beta-lactamase class C family)
VHERRIIWERGFGYQDLDRRIATTPDTPYRIASLTKTFSSTLLMQCVERGTLDLDEPIRRYTAAIPEAAATVRHVMTHTSAGTPGVRFQYDGSRFAALTAVVDACSGRPFRVTLAEEILGPLGMRDSVPGQDLENPAPAVAALFDAETLDRYRRVISRLATPYTFVPGQGVVRTGYPPLEINAAAGLISTIRDLARYDAAIDDRRFLRDSTQAVAWTNARSTTTGQLLPHALGWFRQEYRGRSVIWHYGSWAQFSALYVKVPERDFTLLLLANSGGLSSYFPLGNGDVTSSSFARLFLRLFAEG